MKLHGQYLRLRAHYGSQEEVSVTLDELAEVLGCTHRNALNILGKMAGQGWAVWTPSRGRGRRSLLRFLTPQSDISIQSMMEAMDRRDAVSAAIHEIRSYAGVSALQDTLHNWLAAYFGHHAEMREDRIIDTLRLPIRQPLHTIDPLRMNLLAESFVSSHVFDGLVRRGTGGEELLPGIAHAWETDETRTSWTFHLRKGVLMHNGGILDADDVVHSFSRLIRMPRGRLYSFILRDIHEVTALSPLTVGIRLKAPNELFLSFLCTSRAAVVPREPERTGDGRFARQPVGTGPFKIVALQEGGCVLEAFPHYFQGRAQLDRVEIVHVPWNAGPAMEDAGFPFHIIQNQPPEESAAWSRIHTETFVRKFITCNTKKTGPLSDPVVRADVLACLDGKPGVRERSRHSGRMKCPDTPDGSGSCANSDDPVASRAGRADSSALPGGVPAASISGPALSIATIPQYAADAEFVAGRLAEGGISTAIVTVPPEEFKGAVRMEADLILFSLVRDRDEQLRLFDLYQTLAEHITPRVRSEIEAALSLIARQSDPALRAEDFRTIEQRLIRERHLHILYEKPVETAYLPSVRGVRFNSQGWIDLRHVWFPQR